jgi:hypothetical protein
MAWIEMVGADDAYPVRDLLEHQREQFIGSIVEALGSNSLALISNSLRSQCERRQALVLC